MVRRERSIIDVVKSLVFNSSGEYDMFWRRSSQSSLEMEKEVPSSVLWDLVLDMK